MSAASGPTFGMLLRRYRRAAGLTQEELAERAGLSPEGISALERGVNRAPRKDTVELLAEALALGERDRLVLENAARRRADNQGSTTEAAISSASRKRAGPPLIGREREVDLLDHHLAGNGPPVLVFAGEPGVGKTRLLHEAARRGTEAGWSVLASGCQRRTGQTPYAPVLGALQRSLAMRSPVQRKADLQGCVWMVRLLPELEETLGAPALSWPLPPEQERRLTFEAVARYLANTAGPAGTLLILDDLQWADADAMDLLAALVRGSERDSVRVAAAYRDTELRPEDPFASLLVDLARDGLVAHQRLGALSPRDARALAESLLAGGQPDPAAMERLLRRTGGVPFFIVSCMQALRSGAIAEVPGEDVPWDAAQSVRQRVAALPQPARDVLDFAAVAGPHPPLWLLLAASTADGHGSERVADTLELACRVRLLAEDGEGGYQFAHELIRDVVAADLGSARRAALHRRIAELLERSSSEVPVQQLAYHYVRSGQVDKAATYLEEAGEQAERMGAYTAAEGYYRELVSRLDAANRVLAAAGARRKLGGVLCTLARYGEALEVLEQTAESYRRAGEGELEGQVTAQIGQAHADRGSAHEGVIRLLRLLDSLDAQRLTPGALALLYDVLAQLYHLRGDYANQLASAGRAAELAQVAQDTRLLAQVRMRTGNALRMLGRFNEASAMMEDAIATAEAAHDQLTLASALENVSVVYLLRGDFERASHYVQRAHVLAERSGDPLILQLMTMRRGLNEYGTGDWAQSRRDFERAEAMTEQNGVSWVSAYTALGLGLIDVVQGEREQGLAHLARSIELGQESGDLQALRWAQTVVAESELLNGQGQAARERLEPLLDRPGQQEGLVTYLMPYLAWAHIELGEHEAAARSLADCVARATSESIRLALVDALRVRALLARARGRPEDAAQALDEALILAERIGHPYGRAKLLYTYGKLASRNGDETSARTRFKDALAILRRLRERLYADRCERALASLS